MDNIAKDRLVYSVNVKGNEFALKAFQDAARENRENEEIRLNHRRITHSRSLANFRKTRQKHYEKELMIRPNRSKPLIWNGPDKPR